MMTAWVSGLRPMAIMAEPERAASHRRRGWGRAFGLFPRDEQRNLEELFYSTDRNW